MFAALMHKEWRRWKSRTYVRPSTFTPVPWNQQPQTNNININIISKNAECMKKRILVLSQIVVLLFAIWFRTLGQTVLAERHIVIAHYCAAYAGCLLKTAKRNRRTAFLLWYYFFCSRSIPFGGRRRAHCTQLARAHTTRKITRKQQNNILLFVPMNCSYLYLILMYILCLAFRRKGMCPAVPSSSMSSECVCGANIFAVCVCVGCAVYFYMMSPPTLLCQCWDSTSARRVWSVWRENSRPRSKCTTKCCIAHRWPIHWCLLNKGLLDDAESRVRATDINQQPCAVCSFLD